MPTSLAGPIIQSSKYADTKDPCPIFDGKTWHIYGSGGSSTVEVWEILHLTAESAEGPWREERASRLIGMSGDHMAAPGLIFDEKEHLFHMFIQSDFLALGCTIEHFISTDGEDFFYTGRALSPVENTPEAGVYDPHPAIIHGEKYISYSGMNEVGKPDLYLAKSVSNKWHGPWQREGRLLAHEEVPFHNQHGCDDYEWGLEGSQLIELPNGWVILFAVCFLSQGKRGTRQRVFMAISENPQGPFSVLPPIIHLEEQEWGSGENGHAAGVVVDKQLYLFFQARTAFEDIQKDVWKYGYAKFDVGMLG
ncbi:MAG: hypothetical protein NVSMB66_5130 [Candidatus Doudnabacteria bacterium]